LLKKSKDLGSIDAGKFADVIAVDGNPLDNIALMQHVGFVMKDGVVYKQDGAAVAPPAAKVAAAPSIAQGAELEGY
ncbi:MAG: hypothetical protein ABIS07_17035, partial [Dokdonella sp.]